MPKYTIEDFSFDKFWEKPTATANKDNVQFYCANTGLFAMWVVQHKGKNLARYIVDVMGKEAYLIPKNEDLYLPIKGVIHRTLAMLDESNFSIHESDKNKYIFNSEEKFETGLSLGKFGDNKSDLIIDKIEAYECCRENHYKKLAKIQQNITACDMALNIQDLKIKTTEVW